MKKIISIVVLAKSYSDVNGNSYFGNRIIVNTTQGKDIVKMPIKYGYEDQYKQDANDYLVSIGIAVDGVIIDYFNVYCSKKEVQNWVA